MGLDFCFWWKLFPLFFFIILEVRQRWEIFFLIFFKNWLLCRLARRRLFSFLHSFLDRLLNKAKRSHIIVFKVGLHYLLFLFLLLFKRNLLLFLRPLRLLRYQSRKMSFSLVFEHQILTMTIHSSNFLFLFFLTIFKKPQRHILLMHAGQMNRELCFIGHGKITSLADLMVHFAVVKVVVLVLQYYYWLSRVKALANVTWHVVLSVMELKFFVIVISLLAIFA